MYHIIRYKRALAVNVARCAIGLRFVALVRLRCIARALATALISVAGWAIASRAYSRRVGGLATRTNTAISARQTAIRNAWLAIGLCWVVVPVVVCGACAVGQLPRTSLTISPNTQHTRAILIFSQA